jgi:uncharacterized protein YjiS (DUF1127 family)
MGIEARGRQTLAAASKAQERGTIMNVTRTLKNWRNYRRTVAELERMTSRELEDLGINPYDIRRFARTANGF